MRQPVIALNAFKKEQLKYLTDRLVAVYNKAFDFSPDTSNESILNWTLFELKKATANADFSVREYITKLIEVLDLLQQHPDTLKLTQELDR